MFFWSFYLTLVGISVSSEEGLVKSIVVGQLRSFSSVNRCFIFID